MSGGIAKYRGWLIVIGIVLLILASGLLRFRMRMAFSRMGPILLLLGVALIVLARLGRTTKRKDDE